LNIDNWIANERRPNMSKPLLNLVVVCSLLLVPVAYAAYQVTATVPVEYELVNDFAARLQTHLQQTSKILEQLRRTTDPVVERKKLMNAYLTAVRTTAHITQTMQQLLDGGEGMGGKGMMGGGMMKDGMCAMVSEGRGEAAKKSPAASEDVADEDEGHH
jgi:hypothetical protein